MPLKNNKRPSIEYMRDRLIYDPLSGSFVWRRCALMAHAWNQKHAGNAAFITRHSNGYLIGAIDNRKLYAHDVAWAIHTGAWHEDDIDHDNGVRSDNRIINLRAVDRSANMRNQRLRTDNTSGVTGVSWCVAANKWAAQIAIGGKHVHLGLFPDIKDAADARRLADVQYGFHRRHGTVPEVAGALHIYSPEQLEKTDV